MSAPATQATPLAVVRTEVVEKTAAQIRKFIDQGHLLLPPDYAHENALKAAWIILQETNNRDGQPVLTSCTPASIVNALMAMAVQGLDPLKKQCYFIAYGKTLTCQRSYFGDMAVARRVQPGLDFGYACYYKDDTLGFERVNGKIVAVKHDQAPGNIDNAKLAGAYCVVTDQGGKVVAAEVLTMERIRKSWQMSKTYKAGATGGTHADFPDDMAIRTVIRKTCKPIINSSDDQLLVQYARQSEMDAVDADVAEEAETHGNQTLLAIEAETPVGAAPVPEDHVAVPKAAVEEALAGTAVEAAQPALDEGGPGY